MLSNNFYMFDVWRAGYSQAAVMIQISVPDVTNWAVAKKKKYIFILYQSEIAMTQRFAWCIGILVYWYAARKERRNKTGDGRSWDLFLADMDNVRPYLAGWLYQNPKDVVLQPSILRIR